MIKFDIFDFKKLYKACGYSDFSEDALEVIFDYFEGEKEYTFDPVAYRGVWSEYTKEEMMENYNYLLEDEVEEDEEEIEILVKTLEYKTTVWKLPNGNYLLMDF